MKESVRGGGEREFSAAPIERSPLYKEVLARLQDLVARAELRPGDKLPGERELAVELGVSRNSLRPALAALEALGVLEIRHGSGTFLRSSTVADVAESLAVILLEQNRHLPASLEARMSLERFAAGLAAGRHDDDDIERMEAALAEMQAEIAAGGTGAASDERFHVALVAASHNPVLSELLDSLREPIARIRDESLSQPGRPLRSLEAHWRIVEAVRRSDPRAALAAVDAHLREVGDTVLLRAAEPAV
jgi:GntR family transcriptional regulator, transcriptional repressor for pyruvate dehydrogenase complex